MDKKKIFDVGKYISDEMEDLNIPESLSPENIKVKLEGKQVKTKRNFRWMAPLATAACMGILISAGIYTQQFDKRVAENNMVTAPETDISGHEETNTDESIKKETDRKKIYAASKEFYDKVYKLLDENRVESEVFVYNSSASTGTADADGAEMEDMLIVNNSIAESPSLTYGTGTKGEEYTEKQAVEESEDYATTNVQVEFVDEGDIVKNDGRYLYQMLADEEQQIQIIDTKDGLKEVAVIGGFSGISEFYVSGDLLVVIESLWVTDDNEKSSGGIEYCYDVAYNGGDRFSYIHFYDIADRAKPKEVKKFTLKGAYKTSRISDGFLYFLSGYATDEPESREDLDAYIPVVDGEVLGEDSIFIPEESEATSYLMMVSVDLENPTEFVDKMAVISEGNNYYVSQNNIYVLDSTEGEISEGIVCDKTNIIRFSYDKGQIEHAANGTVNGRVLDQFAMDEHEGYFRIITTVSPYEAESVIDDILNKFIGYHVKEWLPESNSVYVLDDELNVTGKIENLAEDELVYSARFMGDTGYFVTFRQTDPLFSVDFSNPYKPEILGELKISGFSEYLHFYKDNLLLGIGYEADEDTGRTEGVKLSMFDISNPKDVKEINKLVLEECDHSDAFYNHNAVLVNGSKNIIGFTSESYDYDYTRNYSVFSYDDENGFTEKYRLDCTPEDYHYEARGTYINDTFYLLKQQDGVGAYDINTGELKYELTITEALEK